jgi:hypothetical protein
MGELTPIVVTASSAVVIIIALYLVFFYVKKPKRALAEFVQSRGLVIIPTDQGGELERRLVEEIGIPEGGRYHDIIRLPLSVGEAYFYTRLPEPSRTSSTGSSSGSPHHFITVFADIPLKGRTFVVPHVPIRGKFAEKVIEYILNKVFGAKNITLLDVQDQYPDFAKKYNVFTEDEAGARKFILSGDLIPYLMTHPGKKPVNIAFAPGGFGIDIEPQLKSRREMDEFTAWAENLARTVKDTAR